LRGVEQGESRILIGGDAYYIDVLQRMRPASYWKPLKKLEQVAASQVAAAKKPGKQSTVAKP